MTGHSESGLIMDVGDKERALEDLKVFKVHSTSSSTPCTLLLRTPEELKRRNADSLFSRRTMFRRSSSPISSRMPSSNSPTTSPSRRGTSRSRRRATTTSVCLFSLPSSSAAPRPIAVARPGLTLPSLVCSQATTGSESRAQGEEAARLGGRVAGSRRGRGVGATCVFPLALVQSTRLTTSLAELSRRTEEAEHAARLLRECEAMETEIAMLKNKRSPTEVCSSLLRTFTRSLTHLFRSA